MADFAFGFDGKTVCKAVDEMAGMADIPLPTGPTNIIFYLLYFFYD
ncbi:hypothetical protein [Paracoccus jeotgali]|nr:hypothetical protein [Paracoccus jeotgali]